MMMAKKVLDDLDNVAGGVGKSNSGNSTASIESLTGDLSQKKDHTLKVSINDCGYKIADDPKFKKFFKN